MQDILLVGGGYCKSVIDVIKLKNKILKDIKWKISRRFYVSTNKRTWNLEIAKCDTQFYLIFYQQF